MKTKNILILLIFLVTITIGILLFIDSNKRIDFTEVYGNQILYRCSLVDFNEIKINNNWINCRNIVYDIKYLSPQNITLTKYTGGEINGN